MTTKELDDVKRLARHFAFALTGHRAYAAEDRFIDAGVDGWLRARRTWDPTRGTWAARLSRCIRDEVVRAVRRHAEERNRERPVNLDAAEGVPGVDRRPVDFDAFDVLHGDTRSAAVGHFLECRPVLEVAAILRTSVRTVARHLSTARRRLAVQHG